MRQVLITIIFILAELFSGCSLRKPAPQPISTPVPSPDFHFDARQYIYAVEHGDLKTVEYVLGNGIDPDFIDKRDNEEVPMIAAATIKNHQNIVEALLNHGASVDRRNKGYLTHTIYPAPFPPIIGVPRSSGGLDYEYDPLGVTALMIATAEKYTGLVNLLLKHKANPNLRTNRGHTALMFARDIDTVKALIAHNADVFARDNNGETVLMHAGTKEICSALLQAGVDINAQTHDGETLLMGRVGDDTHLEAMQLLLANGANVNAQNHEGKTALMYIAGYKDSYVLMRIQYLEMLSNLSNWGRHKRGRKFLLQALEEFLPLPSCEKTISLLLENGADINLRDKKGKTALTYAEQSRDEARVKIILAHGGIH